MAFVLKCPDVLAEQNLDDLRSLEPHDLIGKVLVGTTETFLNLVPRELVLPEELCRETAAKWRDPQFRRQLRAMTRAAIAAALGARLPGALSDLIAGYLTESLAPAFEAVGDRLLQRLCSSERVGEEHRTETAAQPVRREAAQEGRKTFRPFRPCL